jgi:hypothetical protein
MTGWDVSSTPTWGSEGGPDETQAFTASGNGAGEYGQNFGAPEAGGSYSGGNNMAGGPPSEFYGQEDQGGYPRRTPGQSFQDLPRRGGAADGGYGQDNGFGQGGQQEWGGGGQGGYGGQDWGNQGGGNDGWGQQDNGFGGGGYGQDNGYGGQAPAGFGGGRGGNGGLTAQNDPALQDFFGSQGGPGGGSEFGGGDGGWGGQPAQQDRFGGGNEDVDWTGRPRNRGAATATDDGDVDWTGRPRGRRPSADEEDEDEPGGMGMKAMIAIAVVVVVIIGAGAYIFLGKKHSGTPTAASSTGAASSLMASASATTTAGAGTAGGGAAAGAFTLAAKAPATLADSVNGKYSDTPANPMDLTTAKTTAGTIVTALSTAGVGKATSTTPTVSDVYNLPGQQAMSVVGYQGTFTPTKVVGALSKLGASHVATFKAGPDGGVLSCGDTPTAPIAGLCLWSTSSTLGITEFFNATGPEPFTTMAGQTAIARDTLDAQTGIEKKA